MSSRRDLPFGWIGFGGVVAAGALLVVLGAPRDRSTPRPAPTPEVARVAAGGFTLAAVSADLPADDLDFPAGAGVEAVRANCTSCHSPAMILTQPALTPAQWQATLEKMQKAYHAPVDPKAVPAILTYLSGLEPPPATPR